MLFDFQSRKIPNRAVFNWVSKVISRLLWFYITTVCDWLTKLAPLSQPVGIQTKTNRVLAARVSPTLGASYMYLLRILIGLLYCLHLLRLARVITLVLVSNERVTLTTGLQRVTVYCKSRNNKSDNTVAGYPVYIFRESLSVSSL